MPSQHPHPPQDLTIRPVSTVDLAAVAEIYNHYVLKSVCTFDTQPEGSDYWNHWLAEHTPPFPAIVAVRNRNLVGWGCLSKWNNRCAYRLTAENSVYVKPDCHRQGIGHALLAELIDRARHDGHKNIIARIADHQAASEALHQSFGFIPIGCLEGIGRKFDRWIDVTLWQLKL
ncbi:MAG: GNAT family N-acetyltransferase [Phycisphaerae bacterium]